MFLAILDEQLDADTFTKPTIITLEEFNLTAIDKVLVEVGFGNYEDFTSDHCFTPNTPAEYKRDYYPGTFGDDVHLNYSFEDGVTIGDIISGKANTLVAADDSGDRNAPWARRIRFMKAEKYHRLLIKEFDSRLSEFANIVSNPHDNTIEKYVERRDEAIRNMIQ